MPKYIQVIKNTIAEYMTYRLNFILWRVRMAIRLLVVYFLWQGVLSSRGQIFGYNQSGILTYILASQVVASFITSTKTQDVGGEIQQGDLTNFLLRPMNYFGFLISRDAADKLLNVGFSIVEISIIIFFLRPPLVIQKDPYLLILFLLSVGIGIGLFFCISLLLSLLSFWTQEGWGPRFLFMIINEFLSGGLFPLDILPAILFKLFTILPFSYLLFFPLKVYLGQLTASQIWQGFTIATIWLVILILLVQLVWQKGLRLYTAEGR